MSDTDCTKGQIITMKCLFQEAEAHLTIVLLQTTTGAAAPPPRPAEKGRGTVTMTGSVPDTWSVAMTTVMEAKPQWTVVRVHKVCIFFH